MKRKVTKFAGILLAGFLGVVLVPTSAQAAPKTMPDGTVFDAEYYAANNPDVVAALGNSEDMLYLHYTMFGRAEGRLPVAPGNTSAQADGFDAAYYAARYPDVVAALGSDPAILRAHYNAFGKTEGRFPNAAQEQAARSQQTTTTQTPAVQTPVTQTTNDYAHQVFQLVNEQRSQAGLAPLEWDTSLDNAVTIRAQEIAQVFSHTRPNGSPFYSILTSGPNYYYGENIAAGQRTPESVMNSWMNSSGHRANILNSSYTGMAVGYYKTGSGYGSYWVQIFSRP